MKLTKTIVCSLSAVIAVIAGTTALASREREAVPRPEVVPGFTSGTAVVRGAQIHYVIGGKGPPIILIHGFPQDWTEFRSVMPGLARKFTVLAVDLRGIGGSSTTEDKFDATTLASDVQQVARQLKLERPFVFGHDIGGQVAYAYALMFGREIRGAMISETAIMGLKGTDALDASPALWHVRFMQVPGVSEKLISGRHDVFLGSFLDYGKFSAEERATSLAAYARDDQMKAMLGIYRAFPDNAKFNAAHQAQADIPITFLTGDKSIFAHLQTATVDGLKSAGFPRARAVTVSGSMHYLFADIPTLMARLLEEEASVR